MIHFRPIETFFSEASNNEYAAGMIYTVWPGTVLLAGLVQIWIAEGKVEIINATVSSVTGHGKVT